MSLKPWREIARPHKDVLEGTFQQSEFAADISQVASGTAPAEYQNAKMFFSRTFITEGMRLLLMSVAKRFAGKGGDPVIQLQTAFGGGKTHTMLAVYHLASHQGNTNDLEGIPPLLDDAHIHQLPRARVAVIDGIKLSPSQPQVHGAVTVNTLWGELAWQLLGETGVAMVAESDAKGTSPGKEVLRQLLEKAAPCVILMDELVAYIRQMEPGQIYKAGSFDSNISFIQALTEATKSVPNAIVLASLPESELEVGGSMGQQALATLEKYFARVESVWKPVSATEAFEIVRRRLFEYEGDRANVEGICRQFSDFYRSHSSKFPTETQANVYFERLCQSYPIHPEIFDRLYEDWSTLEKFQRTRGVLQYMAIVIHRLWNSDNRDALITPGSIMLEDSNVRNKSIHYLPPGWEAVLEREVDGERSDAYEIDAFDTRFGAVQAARRVMRTIFLGSAPSTDQQAVRGIQTERILLGSVQPEQTPGVFEDVLKRLRDKLTYLYSDTDRYWLDTRPNLRREMESRKQRLSEKEDLLPLLETYVKKVFGKSRCFQGIHYFATSASVPDDFSLRLVVLPPSSCYNRKEPQKCYEAAETILRYRGNQPRHKQNRLLFLAGDSDVLNRLKDAGRTYFAWKSIVTDIDNNSLDLSISLANQARNNKQSAETSLLRTVREAYRWLLCPIEEFVQGKPKLEWECISISTTVPNLIAEVEQRIKEEEWVISEWSPIHLQNTLSTWYLKNGVHSVSALRVWQDCCQYLYLPRLLDDHVYSNAITAGLESRDFFGFASGQDDDKYLGFIFGHSSGLIQLDGESLLIEREAATAEQKRLDTEKRTKEERKNQGDAKPVCTGEKDSSSGSIPDPESKPETASVSVSAIKSFYGTVELDPVRAKSEFQQVINEVVESFSTRHDVNVSISVEIRAEAHEAFDEMMQNAIKENCQHLKFKSAEFETE